MGWPLRGSELPADGLKRRRVVVVAIHVAQQPTQLVEGDGVEPSVLLQAVLRPVLELFESPGGLRDADDRYVQVAALHHRLQRRKDLLVGEIAGGAEEDEGVSLGRHLQLYFLAQRESAR